MTEVRIEIIDYMEFVPRCWAAIDECIANFDGALLAMVVQFDEGIGRWARRETAMRIRGEMHESVQSGKLRFVVKTLAKGSVHFVNYIVESEAEVEGWEELRDESCRRT